MPRKPVPLIFRRMYEKRTSRYRLPTKEKYMQGTSSLYRLLNSRTSRSAAGAHKKKRIKKSAPPPRNFPTNVDQEKQPPPPPPFGVRAQPREYLVSAASSAASPSRVLRLLFLAPHLRTRVCTTPLYPAPFDQFWRFFTAAIGYLRRRMLFDGQPVDLILRSEVIRYKVSLQCA